MYFKPQPPLPSTYHLTWSDLKVFQERQYSFIVFHKYIYSKIYSIYMHIFQKYLCIYCIEYFPIYTKISKWFILFCIFCIFKFKFSNVTLFIILKDLNVSIVAALFKSVIQQDYILMHFPFTMWSAWPEWLLMWKICATVILFKNWFILEDRQHSEFNVINLETKTYN